jgi:hypothetical protein
MLVLLSGNPCGSCSRQGTHRDQALACTCTQRRVQLLCNPVAVQCRVQCRVSLVITAEQGSRAREQASLQHCCSMCVRQNYTPYAPYLCC